MLIFCKLDQGRADKNRAFSKFEVNFLVQILTELSFLLKNMKLNEQLSVKAFLIILIFIGVYVVKMCPSFVVLPLLQFTKNQDFL